MLIYEDAKEIAWSYLQKINDSHVEYNPVYLAYLRRDDPTYIQERTTAVLTDSQEESFGWIFFYNSREFIKTGDFGHALAGNAPIIVNKQTSELWETGTAHPIEYYIEQYRAKIKSA